VTIVRVGTNKKYAEGWEAAFGGSKPTKKKKAAKKASAKKKASPKKKTVKKKKKVARKKSR